MSKRLDAAIKKAYGSLVDDLNLPHPKDLFKKTKSRKQQRRRKK